MCAWKRPRASLIHVGLGVLIEIGKEKEIRNKKKKERKERKEKKEKRS